jgi:hypothetical protein
LRLTVCTVSGNQTGNGRLGGAGGGIESRGKTLTITGCTISGNRSGDGDGAPGYTGGDGGGMWRSGTVTLTNCTISGNSTGGPSGQGAGLWCSALETEAITINNSTITDNEADAGGGIYHHRGPLTLGSTIVAENTAAAGPDFCLVDPETTAEAYHSLIGNNADSGFDPEDWPNSYIGVPGNLVDPGLDDLADNGGSTQTHAVLPGSLAIDNGHNEGLLFDQRGSGFLREAPPGYPADIGAYENQYQTELLGPVDYQEQDFALSDGGVWCGLETTHDGFLTLEAFDPSVGLRLFNERGKEVEQSRHHKNMQRIDYVVGTGETYYFELLGSGPVDVRLVNLIRHDGVNVYIDGTAGDDSCEYKPVESHQITIKGVEYHFQDDQVNFVEFVGRDGDDFARVVGTSHDEIVNVYPHGDTSGNQLVFQNDTTGFTIHVSESETFEVAGRGGTDTGIMHQTDGTDDVFWGRWDNDRHRNLATMFGGSMAYEHSVKTFVRTLSSYSAALIDFDNVTAAVEQVYLVGGDPIEIFKADPDEVVFEGQGGFKHTLVATEVYSLPKRGANVAYYVDSEWNETYHATYIAGIYVGRRADGSPYKYRSAKYATTYVSFENGYSQAPPDKVDNAYFWRSGDFDDVLYAEKNRAVWSMREDSFGTPRFRHIVTGGFASAPGTLRDGTRPTGGSAVAYFQANPGDILVPDPPSAPDTRKYDASGTWEVKAEGFDDIYGPGALLSPDGPSDSLLMALSFNKNRSDSQETDEATSINDEAIIGLVFGQ